MKVSPKRFLRIQPSRSRQTKPALLSRTRIQSLLLQELFAKPSPHRREQNGRLSPLQSRQAITETVNFGHPNAIEQLLTSSTGAPNSGDIAARVDDKTRKAIVKGEYVDLGSLHENSTASSNIHDLLALTINGESLLLSFPNQRRARKVPIDSFDRWLSAFSVFPTVLLSAFPHRAVEMFAYLSIIQSAHKKFWVSSGWRLILILEGGRSGTRPYPGAKYTPNCT